MTRAGQTIVAHFLADPTATHLLFVEADIGFEPEQVLRLLEFDVDIAAVVYPAKQINWDQMVDAVHAGRAPLESATLSSVVERDPSEPWETRNGFVKARHAGTGFLLIRRVGVMINRGDMAARVDLPPAY